MAYRIVYGPEKKTVNRKGKWGIVAAVGLLALVLAGRFLGWGEYLIPGDPAVTAAAVKAMVESLGDGEQVTAVFADFCREIMDHGALY